MRPFVAVTLSSSLAKLIPDLAVPVTSSVPRRGQGPSTRLEGMDAGLRFPLTLPSSLAAPGCFCPTPERWQPRTHSLHLQPHPAKAQVSSPREGRFVVSRLDWGSQELGTPAPNNQRAACQLVGGAADSPWGPKEPKGDWAAGVSRGAGAGRQALAAPLRTSPLCFCFLGSDF